MKTEILYEDDSILVVYKPAGFAVQTARVGQLDVVSELKNYLRQPQGYLGIIHRLDQPVEGLLVFAKNKKAAAALSAQLQRQEEGTFSKCYYAALWGVPQAEEGELVDYLCKSRENRAVVVDSLMEKPGMSKPRKAVLRYRILQTVVCGEVEEQEHLGGNLDVGSVARDQMVGNLAAGSVAREHLRGNLAVGTAAQKPLEQEKAVALGSEKGNRKIALADIRIETGRFHQIRAQMAYAGTPILGDVKYGDPEAMEAARTLGIRETALCAYLLEFAHPVTRKEMKFRIVPKGKAFSLFSGYKF